MARVPPLTLVRQFDTHRLIPSRYSAGSESVLDGQIDANPTDR